MNGTLDGSGLTVFLAQFTVSGGACTATAVRYFAEAALASNEEVDIAPSVPLLVKPIKGAPYCLGLETGVTNGAVDATSYYPRVSFGGYVWAGSYTGLGTSATPSATLSDKKAH